MLLKELAIKTGECRLMLPPVCVPICAPQRGGRGGVGVGEVHRCLRVPACETGECRLMLLPACGPI